MGDLDGKTVLVSGVGPGLGDETARIALREGADVTDPAACAHLVDAVVDRFGVLDGIVHVAAHDASFGYLAGADLDEWREVIPEDDDVAEMACFLLSDRARTVTGQTIWVNAGEFIT